MIVFLPPALALVLGVPTLYGLNALGVPGDGWIGGFLGIAVGVAYLLLGWVIVFKTDSR